MTSDEIKVVIAAAIVFVIINIIMWSVIAAVNRSHRKKQSPSAPATVMEGPPGERILLIQPNDDFDSRKSDRFSEVLPTQQPLKGAEPDATFRITSSTLITHTDERL